MTKFGIITWVDPDEPIRDMQSFAGAVEDLGFNSLWVWDTPLYTKDAYTALTLAALGTKRILLGPGVSNPVTRDVATMVNAMSTLDDLSDGRAVFGFASGGHGAVNALGYTAPKFAQFRELLSRARTLLKGEEVVVDESIRYAVNAVRRPIPIYTASAGPRMLKLSGELADGVLLAGSNDLGIVVQNMAHFYEGAKTAGRREEDVKVNIQVTVSCNPDLQVAINDLKKLVTYLVLRRAPNTFPEEFVQAIQRIQDNFNYRTSPSAFGSEVLNFVPDALVNHMAIAGTEEECLEHLRKIVDLKPDEITFRLLSTGRLDRLKQLAALVSKL